MLRIYAALAVGLMLCPLAPGPVALERAFAREQLQAAQAKKRIERKTAAPKSAVKDEHERTAFSAEEDNAAIVPGIPDARVWGDSAVEFARLLPQANGPWLAISGGGSDGAFGAGVLTGWTQSGTRPEFAAVTGVSIGALIAPFAFLGPRYDEEVHKNFTTIGAADIFEDRKTHDSLFDDWPLKRLIEDRVTPKLLAEIAAEHARGRRLFVATTNLDGGRRVVWNLGAIATHGDHAALKLFRDILLASCSIPGFFSPVAIEVEANGKKFHEMHSDGTITAPFFVVPETMLSASGPARAPFSELYVLVNSKLGPEFKMPDPTIPGVLGRSIAVALTSALRAQLMLVYAGVQRHGVSLRVAHVDTAFDYPSRGPFDGKYMQALYEFGVAAGKKGDAFDAALPELSMRGQNSR
ncbi:MAG TPA: patatin-like phospholipase family protein [Xanthobacteraceae bacterium]